MQYIYEMQLYTLPTILPKKSPDIETLPVMDTLIGMVEAETDQQAYSEAWTSCLGKMPCPCSFGDLNVIREENTPFEAYLSHMTPEQKQAIIERMHDETAKTWIVCLSEVG